MKVRAIKNGFYGGKYRYIGDVFTIVPVEGVAGPDKHRTKKVFTVEQQFSSSWMEKIDGKKVNAPIDEPKAQEPPTTPAGAGSPTGDEDVI